MPGKITVPLHTAWTGTPRQASNGEAPDICLPTDYRALFANRTILITGVGRSGTTILGKILGSMKRCYYVFEPAILKYLAAAGTESLLGTLAEDYCIPLVQGRGNANPLDWSYQGNYLDVAEIERRRKVLRRREDAMKFIEDEQSIWVFKLPEYQPWIPFIRTHIPGIKIVDVIRDGREVVRSFMERGWYNDDYCDNRAIEWSRRDFMGKIPAFVGSESRGDWPRWNVGTRGACVWRTLTTHSVINSPDIKVRYETFIREPSIISDGIRRNLGLENSELSLKHIASVKNHKHEDKPEFPIDSISEPERFRFLNALHDMGYE